MMLGSALASAQGLYRFSIERAKKDARPRPGVPGAQLEPASATRRSAPQRTLDPKADRALMRYALVDVAKLPADQRIEALDKEIGLKPGMAEADAGKAIDAWLDKLFAGTKIDDKATSGCPSSTSPRRSSSRRRTR